MNKKWKIFVAILAVLLVIILACGIYVGDYYRAGEVAVVAMADGSGITVTETKDRTVFAPDAPEAGLIFYPGGKVEYTAYAPLMKALAEKSILCVLLEMPCNLAVLDMSAAEGIPAEFPEIDTWYIGGHSLGGSMAASYAAEHTEEFSGLVLLAAYSTAEITDLSVISLYGSEDGVMNREKYQECRKNLPENTVETVIEGGNHAFFGNYGLQDGDGEALITAEDQIVITAEELFAFIFGTEYELTPAEQIQGAYENEKFVITKAHYRNSDGEWVSDGYIYQYRLEITGRLHNAVKNTTYVVLSNTKDITFDQTWKASGLSSNLDDYFDPAVAAIVGHKLFS